MLCEEPKGRLLQPNLPVTAEPHHLQTYARVEDLPGTCPDLHLGQTSLSDFLAGVVGPDTQQPLFLDSPHATMKGLRAVDLQLPVCVLAHGLV